LTLFRAETNDRKDLYGGMREFKALVSKLNRSDLTDRTKLEDIVPHFNEHDRRLSLSDTDGRVHGTMEGVGPIICYKLEEAELGSWAKLPKIIHIYAKLSARSQVQSLYGILDKSSRKYAIMEDVSSLQTLASMVQARNLPPRSTDRVRIAWEIANTVAYLHQVGILLKSLSDSSVSIKEVQNEIRPIVTDLESARLVGFLYFLYSSSHR
jgi:hypothetical protein